MRHVGDVAQSVVAPPCHGGGRGFKSRRSRMNFKRKGPKSTRAGCLLCKYHKEQNFKHSDKAKAKRQWRKIIEKAY